MLFNVVCLSFHKILLKVTNFTATVVVLAYDSTVNIELMPFRMTLLEISIKQIIDIDLPRPRRRTELLLDPRYQKYVVDIERMFDDAGDAELQP